MKTTILRAALALAVCATIATASARQIANDLNGKLVSLRGHSALPATTPDLPQAKYIALYFSAGWCGPCHQFTPKLVDFYKEMKAKHPEFEVIFMSRDESPNDMEKYMAEMSMPWPALRYSAAKSDRALNKYCGSGIPDLVVLNEKGDILSDSFAGKTYLGPYKVMDDLRKMLNEGSSAVASAGSDSSPASKIDSPSGTDWDKTFKHKSP
ncbi:MAG TPA: thioredoxin-like domain-containing protein [Chthoniobacterales bacterium]|jgi:nucleoredoxin